MYALLVKWMGKNVANGVMIIWYCLLIFLVYYFYPVESGEFRYLRF